MPSVAPDDLERLPLLELRRRFMAEHDSGMAALARGAREAFNDALDRQRPYLKEVLRRIVLHSRSVHDRE